MMGKQSRNMQRLVCCNIVVILIRLSALIGSNCSDYFIMHVVGNATFVTVVISLRPAAYLDSRVKENFSLLIWSQFLKKTGLIVKYMLGLRLGGNN
jgi:hypothetical protein